MESLLPKESLAPSKHVFVPVVLAASFAKVKDQDFAILVMERAVGSLQAHAAGKKDLAVLGQMFA